MLKVFYDNFYASVRKHTYAELAATKQLPDESFDDFFQRWRSIFEKRLSEKEMIELCIDCLQRDLREKMYLAKPKNVKGCGQEMRM